MTTGTELPRGRSARVCARSPSFLRRRLPDRHLRGDAGIGIGTHVAFRKADRRDGARQHDRRRSRAREDDLRVPR